jgi:hypothetical protein
MRFQQAENACHLIEWGGRRGSNPRPLESQSRALPTELLPPLPSLLLRQMVRPAGLEPATPGLEGRCSIRLSYGRLPGIVSLVPMENRCSCAGCGCSMPIGTAYRTLRVFEPRSGWLSSQLNRSSALGRLFDALRASPSLCRSSRTPE